MPTYLYECPVHKELEIEHSINEELTECPRCLSENPEETPHKLKRLISGGTGFILSGSGWAKDRYS